MLHGDTRFSVELMEILFLGTGAAEGWPGLFCECEYCQKARKLGGKNVRTRSSVHIDEKYKVDLPPDTYLHMLQNNLNYAKVEHLFFTHTHYDHFHPQSLIMRHPPFAHMKHERALHVYGNRNVIGAVEQALATVQELNVTPHFVEPFVSFKAGEMHVIPVLADHSPDETCLNYIFEIKGKTILHGYDSGWFPQETWHALKRVDLDVAVLDCTNGGVSGTERYHMSINGVLRVKEQMKKWSIASEETSFVATHFSHGGQLLHQQLAERLTPYGVLVAYDGMHLEI